jgi:23S rRNA pseudouridine1911/1915/1917 synthase
MIPFADVVLHEDNHCLAVNKPAGWLSQADQTGDPSVVDLARQYLKARYNKPGNVYVGLVHRLDRPVSGVLLLARTSKAAARLARAFHDNLAQKTYWAWVEGRWPDRSGSLADCLIKDHASNRVRVARPGEPGARLARLEYRVLARAPRATLLELKPATGRAHQLRVQLASRGYPILGDQRYGSRQALPAADGGRRIALHARSLEIMHPTSRATLALTAPVPEDWPAFALLDESFDHS